jgi:hypothetical protein
MDVRFLKEISEAYILDNKLKEIDPTCDSDSIATHLYELVVDLRENDIELYDMLYDRSKVTQQQIFKTYLDSVFEEIRPTQENTEEVLTEFGLESIGYGILMIIAYFTYKDIPKVLFGTLSKVGHFFESFGKAVSKQGRYFKFRYAIIQQNSKQCYVRCGITAENLSMTSYFAVSEKKPLFKGMLTTTEGLKQGTCLSECYLSSLVDVIALYMKSYFICMKTTGGDNNIGSFDPDEIMKVISKTNISAHCKPMYDQAHEAFKNFERVLSFIYKDEQEAEKTKWINTLRSKLYQSKKEIEGSKDFNKYR